MKKFWVIFNVVLVAVSFHLIMGVINTEHFSALISFIVAHVLAWHGIGRNLRKLQ